MLSSWSRHWYLHEQDEEVVDEEVAGDEADEAEEEVAVDEEEVEDEVRDHQRHLSHAK